MTEVVFCNQPKDTGFELSAFIDWNVAKHLFKGLILPADVEQIIGEANTLHHKDVVWSILWVCYFP